MQRWFRISDGRSFLNHRVFNSRERVLLFLIVTFLYLATTTYLGFLGSFKPLVPFFPIIVLWLLLFAVMALIKVIRNVRTYTASERILAFIVFFASFLVTKTSFFFPDYSWDGQAYHLPMSVEWMKSSRISIVDLSLYASTYPGLSVLMLAIWFSAFSLFGPPHNVSQICGYFLILFSVNATADVYKLPRKLKLILLAFSATIPNFLLQATTAYNDLFFNSLIILSVTCLVIYARESARERFMAQLVLALAGGLVASTKFTGMYFLVAFALLHYFLYRIYRAGSQRMVLITTFSAFAVCAPWYLRNLVQYSNPMYPLSIEIFGRTLFKGSLGTPDGAFFDYFAERAGIQNSPIGVLRSWFWWPIQYPVYDTRVGGSGLLFIFAFSFAFVLMIFRSNREHLKKLPSEMKLILVFAFTSVFIVPAGWWPRYVLFFPLIVGALAITLFYFSLERFRVILVVFVLATTIEALFYFSFFAGRGMAIENFVASKTTIADSYESIIESIVSTRRLNIYERVAPELKSIADQGELAVYVHKYGYKYFPLYGLHFQNSVDHALERVINPRYMPQGPGKISNSMQDLARLTLVDRRSSVIVTEDKEFVDSVLEKIKGCSPTTNGKVILVWCP